MAPACSSDRAPFHRHSPKRAQELDIDEITAAKRAGAGRRAGAWFKSGNSAQAI
jgi:hypothetical protein